MKTLLYGFMAISLTMGGIAAYKTIDLMNHASQVMLTATGQQVRLLAAISGLCLVALLDEQWEQMVVWLYQTFAQ